MDWDKIPPTKEELEWSSAPPSKEELSSISEQPNSISQDETKNVKSFEEAKERLSALGLGALKTGSMGWADELYGTAAAAKEIPSVIMSGISENNSNAPYTGNKPTAIEHLLDTRRQERQRLEDLMSEYNKKYPRTFNTGEITGDVALMAIPGVGEAKGPWEAAKAYGKLGAAYGLGESEADLTKGEFGKAAADTVIGGLAGGLLGAGGNVAGKYIGKGIDPKLVQEHTDKVAARALGALDSDFKGYGMERTQRMGKTGLDKILNKSGMTTKEINTAAKELESTVGPEIGKLYGKASGATPTQQELINSIVPIFSKSGDVELAKGPDFDNIKKLVNQYYKGAETIGNVEYRELLDRLADEAYNLKGQQLGSAEKFAQAKSIGKEEYLKRISNQDPDLSKAIEELDPSYEAAKGAGRMSEDKLAKEAGKNKFWESFKKHPFTAVGEAITPSDVTRAKVLQDYGNVLQKLKLPEYLAPYSTKGGEVGGKFVTDKLIDAKSDITRSKTPEETGKDLHSMNNEELQDLSNKIKSLGGSGTRYAETLEKAADSSGDFKDSATFALNQQPSFRALLNKVKDQEEG